MRRTGELDNFGGTLRKMAILEFQQVCRRFENCTPIDNFSLALEPGARVLLQGENGSGKSTLIRLAAGLLEPSSGTVLFAGRAWLQHSQRERCRVGAVLSGDGGWIERLNGEENLYYFASLWGLSPPELVRSLAPWREWVLLKKALATPCFQASMGMRQALRVVRSLLTGAELVLWDEPLRSLDADGINFIQEWWRTSGAERTLIVASPLESAEIAGPWTQIVRAPFAPRAPQETAK